MLYCLNVGTEYSNEGHNSLSSILYCSILDTDDWVSESINVKELIDCIENGKLSVNNIVKLKHKKGSYYVLALKLIKWGYNEFNIDLVVVLGSKYLAVWKNNNLIMFELERTISKNNIKYSYISKKFKSDSFIYINIYLDSGSICMCVVEDEFNGVRGLKNEEVIHCKKEDIKKMLLFR